MDRSITNKQKSWNYKEDCKAKAIHLSGKYATADKINFHRSCIPERLEREGYIQRSTKPRAIELLDDTTFFSKKEIVNIPVVRNRRKACWP